VQTAAAELVGYGMADPQLALFRLAVGRSHRRAAPASDRRDELGDGRAAEICIGRWRADGADRSALWAHLRFLFRAIRISEWSEDSVHVSADRRMLWPNRRGNRRHQGQGDSREGNH